MFALTFTVSTRSTPLTAVPYKMASLPIRQRQTLTCLPILRHALSFSVGEDGHQGHGVQSTRIKVLQDRVVGASRHLSLCSGTTHAQTHTHTHTHTRTRTQTHTQVTLFLMELCLHGAHTSKDRNNINVANIFIYYEVVKRRVLPNWGN